MLIDLDRFKPVNDLHGHAAGDLVLCEAARRLEHSVERGSTVARLGGDEFVVIVPIASGDSPIDAGMAVAGRITAELRQPIRIGQATVQVGASIGIATCPGDGLDTTQLLRAADLAMYRAKQGGRGSYRFFEHDMDEDVRARAALETDLRAAVAGGEIRPYFQPLVGLNDHAVRGFEVLARWEHPERGFISPDIFINLAEQLGLAGDLTVSILRQACRAARDWGDDVRLAVNIWPAQLQDRVFPLRVLAVLSEESFPPHRLELEVTESALVGDVESAKGVLADLRKLGISIALDDFGTGYSSLYHLRELSFDKLKIDRSFTMSMLVNAESDKIVDAMLGLARSLGMKVVAEGIETREMLAHLVERGCDFGQGYLFSKAVPAAAAEQILREPQESLGVAFEADNPPAKPRRKGSGKAGTPGLSPDAGLRQAG